MGARLVLTHLHDNHGTADTHRPAVHLARFKSILGEQRQEDSASGAKARAAATIERSLGEQQQEEESS
jgi:hypothetical protein